MLMARPAVRMIHYSLQGVDAPATVDEFKFHLGYVRRPVRRHVVFHPVVAPLVNRTTHAILRSAHTRWARSSFLSKSEGMVRVFLESRDRP
jgi:hypothetical protein